MKVAPDEVAVVLGTLLDGVFAPAAKRALEVLRQGGSTTRSESPVPVVSLVRTYQTRRENPALPRARAEDFDKLLSVLADSAGDAWDIYAIAGRDGRLNFAVFSTSTGIGRACLDVSR